MVQRRRDDRYNTNKVRQMYFTRDHSTQQGPCDTNLEQVNTSDAEGAECSMG
jgi:hypothetical protein